MAVKTTGSLSLTTDIVGEFADTAPHSLTEFYRGAGKVPDVADNSNVPTSGAISMTDFYGAVDALYVTATGGSVTTDGDYKIHEFTSSGTFAVTEEGNSAGSNEIEYVIIAGGGSGGGGGAGGGGGGGAGGMYEGTATLSVSGDYAITVGAGGTAGGTNSNDGNTNGAIDSY